MMVAFGVVHRVIHNIRGYGRFLISKAMDAQKPDNSACLSRDPGKNFFRGVNYLTLLERFLNDAA
jgi:hypothetical protein